MFTFSKYLKASSLEEAYEVLTKNKNNAILGGTAYMKMGNRHLNTVVDLSSLNLDFIIEDEEKIEIGAMTTLRSIEVSGVLKENFHGIVALSVKDIVGVQLRNIATVGATVFSKYGFSDFIPALLALDARVVLFKRGEVSLDEFLQSDREQDILEKIVIRKKALRASFQTIRRSKSDYAVLNVVVSKDNGNVRIVVGARPGRAVLAKNAMKILKDQELTDKNIHSACEAAAEELIFGDNMRASGEYRKAVCKVMLKRALMEVI